MLSDEDLVRLTLDGSTAAFGLSYREIAAALGLPVRTVCRPTVEVVGRAPTEADAVQVAGEVKLAVTPGKVIGVRVVSPRGDNYLHLHRREQDIDLVVRVPKGVAVAVENRLGKVDVANLDAALEVRSDLAEIDVSNIHGKVTLAGNMGRIRVRNVDGDINVTNENLRSTVTG